MNFADTLKTLPGIDHIASIELVDENGQVVASIPNAPGKAGSVAVYHALWQRHGALNAAAAQEGLTLFADHTPKAREQPGAHPNIDRLFEVVERGTSLKMQLTHKVN